MVTPALATLPLGRIRLQNTNNSGKKEESISSQSGELSTTLVRSQSLPSRFPLVVPNSFALEQNYPNPFNPVTTIAYTVPAIGKVRLEVFDVLGRSVAVLFDGDQTVGTYTVRFDGTHLASGLYLYRLTAGTNVQVKKMMMLK